VYWADLNPIRGREQAGWGDVAAADLAQMTSGLLELIN
jgi:hypothetical protein